MDIAIGVSVAMKVYSTKNSKLVYESGSFPQYRGILKYLKNLLYNFYTSSGVNLCVGD